MTEYPYLAVERVTGSAAHAVVLYQRPDLPPVDVIRFPYQNASGREMSKLLAQDWVAEHGVTGALDFIEEDPT